MKYPITSLIISLLLFINATNVSAFPKTDQDFAMLPPYCAARSGRTPKEYADQWERRIGHDWIHLHHYCSGLNSINHATISIDKKETQKLLKHAISAFDYVLTHGSKNNPILPSLHANKGDVYTRLKQPTQAIKEYEKAIAIAPKYTKAYAGLSNVYKSQGNKDKAIETIKKGLKQKPKSKLLISKLNSLEK